MPQRPLRVGIDVRKLGDGGIGRYIRETLVALSKLEPARVRFVAFGPPELRPDLPIDGIEWVGVRAGKYSFAEHFELPAAARRSGVDVFHSPHYVLPVLLRSPAVVTVHDIIHLLHPRSSLHRLYARWMIASACRRARRVITGSETTARDLQDRLHVPADKIRVIPYGVAPSFRRLPEHETRAHLERLGVPRPYILFVGNWLPHKNVETLVRAWAKVAAPRPALVLCGGGFDRARVVWQAVDETGLRDSVRWVGSVDEEALVALYSGAELLASTSLYEGFGLPVVEAFACGTPVLGPDEGAVPEVAGDGALLVPPRRVDMIADGMYRLLRDQELRGELAEKGLRRAKRFSWDEAARKTLSVYEEVTRTSR
jgi:glycosyltransferase involved in cell wall biosynthesis